MLSLGKEWQKAEKIQRRWERRHRGVTPPRFRPSVALYSQSLVFIRFAIQSVESRGIFSVCLRVPFNVLNRRSNGGKVTAPDIREPNTVQLMPAARGIELMIPCNTPFNSETYI